MRGDFCLYYRVILGINRDVTRLLLIVILLLHVM